LYNLFIYSSSELFILNWFNYPISLFASYLRMLYTIAVILLILWLLGVVTSYTIGGFIHVLLVIAIIMVLIRLIRGENPIS
jgi:hypothetical protein